MHVLVTGGAGFIGQHVCQRLLTDGHHVLCVDNTAERKQLEQLIACSIRAEGKFQYRIRDIRRLDGLRCFFGCERFDLVIHLAARAGVRPSLAQPALYSDVNIHGTINVLECCREYSVKDMLFASSSSVYGIPGCMPLQEDHLGAPLSPYAATKRAGELFCATYAHLYHMRIACLRFFTVYGPGQRSDLAIHTFARHMAAGQLITMYGDGSSQRDYTYIDDIADGIMLAWQWLQRQERGICEAFNLGSGFPVSLHSMIALLEDALGIQTTIHRHPVQPGDMPITYADLRKAKAMLGYAPKVDLVTGLQRFAAWFKTQQGALA